MSSFISRIVFPLLLFYTTIAQSQEVKDTEALLINKWKLEKYEINGTFFPPREGHETDVLILSEDHKAFSSSNGTILKGTWTFNKENKSLIIEDTQNNFKLNLKVLDIQKGECKIEIVSEEQPIKAYLKAIQ
ncbi:hypothetical protein [Flavobacterium sp.]|uniref:hypothetical protein n=1 Tax=Flavobacterium sp. TaxID=239 RepID=UPI0028BE0084|nr:hypothetical protein [Flavobacterium sp.]